MYKREKVMNVKCEISRDLSSLRKATRSTLRSILKLVVWLVRAEKYEIFHSLLLGTW